MNSEQLSVNGWLSVNSVSVSEASPEEIAFPEGTYSYQFSFKKMFCKGVSRQRNAPFLNQYSRRYSSFLVVPPRNDDLRGLKSLKRMLRVLVCTR